MCFVTCHAPFLTAALITHEPYLYQSTSFRGYLASLPLTNKWELGVMPRSNGNKKPTISMYMNVYSWEWELTQKIWALETIWNYYYIFLFSSAHKNAGFNHMNHFLYFSGSKVRGCYLAKSSIRSCLLIPSGISLGMAATHVRNRSIFGFLSPLKQEIRARSFKNIVNFSHATAFPL